MKCAVPDFSNKQHGRSFVRQQKGRSMTTREQVEQVVGEIITEQVFPCGSYSLDASLESYGYDSLDAIDMLMALEEEFAIDVPDADAERWRTARDVVDYVYSMLEKTGTDADVSGAGELEALALRIANLEEALSLALQYVPVTGADADRIHELVKR